MLSAKLVYYDACNKLSARTLKDNLIEMFDYHKLSERELVILCVGSDRSTGDSLGPLIGYKLEKYRLPSAHIYGTLQNPVHAANLADTIENINNCYNRPFILAIDASLGTREHIGYITLSNGPLRPGLGVRKELPDVGDIHITGIVNFSGMMESLLLQTTRLSKVMQLADTISSALFYGITEFYKV